MAVFNMKGEGGEFVAEGGAGKAFRGFKRGFLFFMLLIAFLIMNPFGTIGAGERGVLLRFSAVTGKILGEGLYFRIPIVERVVTMDIKIQKEQAEASAASKDLQTVHSNVAINFHIDPERVAGIYQEVGIDYKERLIDPAMQEGVKAITARFTAEELITKREMVKDEVKALLRDKLQPRGILVDEFNIVDFGFSASFNSAIEAKVTAEQQALAAKNKLEQIKFEADQRVAEARGKAEAIRVESEALRSNPQILELRALEKWDGVLPQVTGSGGVPFINLTRANKQ
jgi:regulator of protease activity HflC (stomatin/prohibitin superfamily)